MCLQVSQVGHTFDRCIRVRNGAIYPPKCWGDTTYFVVTERSGVSDRKATTTIHLSALETQQDDSFQCDSFRPRSVKVEVAEMDEATIDHIIIDGSVFLCCCCWCVCAQMPAVRKFFGRQSWDHILYSHQLPGLLLHNGMIWILLYADRCMPQRYVIATMCTIIRLSQALLLYFVVGLYSHLWTSNSAKFALHKHPVSQSR